MDASDLSHPQPHADDGYRFGTPLGSPEPVDDAPRAFFEVITQTSSINSKSLTKTVQENEASSDVGTSITTKSSKVSFSRSVSYKETVEFAESNLDDDEGCVREEASLNSNLNDVSTEKLTVHYTTDKMLLSNWDVLKTFLFDLVVQDYAEHKEQTADWGQGLDSPSIDRLRHSRTINEVIAWINWSTKVFLPALYLGSFILYIVIDTLAEGDEEHYEVEEWRYNGRANALLLQPRTDVCHDFQIFFCTIGLVHEIARMIGQLAPQTQFFSVWETVSIGLAINTGLFLVVVIPQFLPNDSKYRDTWAPTYLHLYHFRKSIDPILLSYQTLPWKTKKIDQTTFIYLFKTWTLVSRVVVWMIIMVFTAERLGLSGNDTLQNPDDPDLSVALWWMVTTITTIGYGDIYPSTQASRIVTMMLMVVVLIILPQLVTDALNAREQYKQTGGAYSKMWYASTKHVVITGGSVDKDDLEMLLRGISSEAHVKNKPIPLAVIMTEEALDESTLLYYSAPYWKKRVKILVGNCVKSESLDRAAIKSSQAIFILADNYSLSPKSKTELDAATVMRVWSILEAAPNVTQYVQCHLSETQTHLIHPNVFPLCLGEYRTGILGNSCLLTGFSTLMTQMLTSFSHEGRAIDLVEKRKQIESLTERIEKDYKSDIISEEAHKVYQAILESKKRNVEVNYAYAKSCANQLLAEKVEDFDLFQKVVDSQRSDGKCRFIDVASALMDYGITLVGVKVGCNCDGRCRTRSYKECRNSNDGDNDKRSRISVRYFACNEVVLYPGPDFRVTTKETLFYLYHARKDSMTVKDVARISDSKSTEQSVNDRSKGNRWLTSMDRAFSMPFKSAYASEEITSNHERDRRNTIRRNPSSDEVGGGTVKAGVLQKHRVHFNSPEIRVWVHGDVDDKPVDDDVIDDAGITDADGSNQNKLKQDLLSQKSDLAQPDTVEDMRRHIDLGYRHVTAEWVETFMDGAIVIDSSEDENVDRDTFHQIIRQLRQIRANHKRGVGFLRPVLLILPEQPSVRVLRYIYTFPGVWYTAHQNSRLSVLRHIVTIKVVSMAATVLLLRRSKATDNRPQFVDALTMTTAVRLRDNFPTIRVITELTRPTTYKYSRTEREAACDRNFASYRDHLNLHSVQESHYLFSMSYQSGKALAPVLPTIMMYQLYHIKNSSKVSSDIVQSDYLSMINQLLSISVNSNVTRKNGINFDGLDSQNPKDAKLMRRSSGALSEILVTSELIKECKPGGKWCTYDSIARYMLQVKQLIPIGFWKQDLIFDSESDSIHSYVSELNPGFDSPTFNEISPAVLLNPDKQSCVEVGDRLYVIYPAETDNWREGSIIDNRIAFVDNAFHTKGVTRHIFGSAKKENHWQNGLTRLIAIDRLGPSRRKLTSNLPPFDQY